MSLYVHVCLFVEKEPGEIQREPPPSETPAVEPTPKKRQLKGIVVEPREEKKRWKTIYVVPPICPYCKMQFRAYSSLKMHYR